MIIASILIALLTAMATYLVIKKTEMTPTRVSSIISLSLFGIIHSVEILASYKLNFVYPLIFGASFVGMCSHKVITKIEVLLASVIFTFIFLYALPLLPGIGGALGFSAFSSLLMMKGLSSMGRFIYQLKKSK